MTNNQDKQYIIALQNSDYQGIKEIYEDFSGGILHWIKKNSGTAQDAEDIFNEALIVIFEKVKHPDFELKYPFEKLLFGVCRNKWRDRLKKNKREQTVINDLKEGLIIEDNLQSQIELLEQENHRQRKLDAAFEQLSDLCKQLLLLYKTGTSPADIAKKLNMNAASTVSRRKNACIDRWRKLFKKTP